MSLTQVTNWLQSDEFFRLLLLPSQPELLVPFLTLGYLALDQRKYGLIIFVTLFSAIINTYLKYAVWRIPLNPELGLTGMAFPSGHMQFASTLWLMLAVLTHKRWLYPLIIIMLIVNGIATVHFRYHDYYDIIGGAIAGATIVGFFFLIHRILSPAPERLGLITSSLSLAIIYLLLPHPIEQYWWAWLYTGITFTLALGWMIYAKLYGNPNNNNILLTICAAIFIAISWRFLYNHYVSPSPKAMWLHLASGAIFGLLISIIAPYLARIGQSNKKKQKRKE
jgi:undecaprenyl-diphosphatase